MRFVHHYFRLFLLLLFIYKCFYSFTIFVAFITLGERSLGSIGQEAYIKKETSRKLSGG